MEDMEDDAENQDMGEVSWVPHEPSVEMHKIDPCLSSLEEQACEQPAA